MSVAPDQPPLTIDQAIAAMDRDIERFVANGDRRGYFAGMYRAVTARVRDGLDRDEFDDGERMERFDVVFARRYLDACSGWERGHRIPSSWQLAFDASALTDRLVLQHLLLGINAHINFDLGLAAADATGGEEIRSLEADFERINDVLAELVDQMQEAISIVSPWSGLVDRIGLRLDETFVCFNLRRARRDAWQFALDLAASDAQDRSRLIATRDREVTQIGERIVRPGMPMRWVARVAQRRERHDLRRVLDELQPRTTP
jgi:hypothetical protein